MFGYFTMTKKQKKAKGSKVGGKTFRDMLAENDLVLVYFWSKICMMCHLMAPTVSRVGKELGIKTVKVDTGKHHKMAVKYGVSLTPTVLLFKNGEPIKSFAGVHSYNNIKKGIVKAMNAGGGGEE